MECQHRLVVFLVGVDGDVVAGGVGREQADDDLGTQPSPVGDLLQDGLGVGE